MGSVLVPLEHAPEFVSPRRWTDCHSGEFDALFLDEVRAALASPDDFERGPRELSRRGTRHDDTPAFVVEDGRYVSGRWPGDAYLIAKRLMARLTPVRG
jgi:hypothetical protein